MSKSVNLLQRLALTYKASRFPWKKHALVGYDLSGNEYWDCPNPLGGRMKRWVQMKNVPRGNLTIFEENQLPVQWQAWLRHTRDYPPTIEELIQDEKRKSIVKERARALEQEWEQRKLQLQQEAEKEKQLLEESSRKEKDKSEEPKSTEPAGQGDTFTPGEWNPTVSKR